MTIVDLEHTDVWNPDTATLEPLTIAKAKFRDFGGSLAYLFGGRQVESELTEVEKANPYHDPRTGRFTFAPANDMGGGGGALTPMGEREAFAARIRQAREDLGEIDYALTSESILDETAEARTLQKQIEFGHIVRTEIDRRMAAAVASPEHSARVEELKRAEELVHDEMGRLIARKETMWAERERRRTAVVEAEQAMNRARDTSPDYNRIKARHDEVAEKRRTAFHEFRAERDRLGQQYDAANPHNPEEMSLWTHMERRDTWVKDQPSYQRAYDQHTLYSDEAAKWKRYLDEVDHNGVTPRDLNGADGPGSRTPLKVSDDNPLKRDPFLMEALDAQTAARKSLKEYDADSYADQMNALWEKKRAAESATNAFSGQTRRRIIKETLEDAGVEFSDGRVLLSREVLDGADLFAAQRIDPSIRHWSETGSIVTTSLKRSKAVRSVEEVAPFVPKRWAVAINNEAIQRRGRGIKIEFDRNRRGEFGNFEIRTDGANTSLHELMHAVEASSDRVPRFEKAFFRYRTRGETAVRLKDLRPKARYGADEMTKPDKFYNPYVGKIYGGRYHELLTMTYADMMYQRGEDGFKKLDPELQAWLWSTLILA
jgi:hypothetical protein